MPKSLSVVLAMVAFASAGVMLTTSPAGAHTDFIGSTPSEGASLDEIPRELRLEFSDAMDPGLSTVALRVEGGGSTSLQLQNGTNRNVLLATVPPSLQPDDGSRTTWTATFRVVSRDGHPVVGTLEFTVRTPTAARPSKTPSPTPLPSNDASSAASPAGDQPDDRARNDSGWLLVAVGVGVLGVLVLAAGATVRLVGRDRDT